MERYPFYPVRSALPGIDWPAVPDRKGAALLALLYQLQQSEWLSPPEIERRQYGQASRLANHAADTVPFYRARLAAAGVPLGRRLSPEEWRRIPPMSREDIQAQGDRLLSRPYPKSHGETRPVSTSGSTGKPVTVITNAVTQQVWQAITLRDHIWQRRDLGLKFAAIRKIKGHDTRERRASRFASWQPPVSYVFPSGPAALCSVNTGLEEQLAWLREEQPAYLLSYPSNLQALIDLCRQQGTRVPGLRQIRTMAEIVSPELRHQCREVLGVDIADMYSAQECGYFALQCPGHEHYLVQADSCLLEVLRDDGEPCGVGETGRVVVTPLVNFAMPLLRYEIGDYATVGGPSPCGRGLPVLERILGRVRNMLVQPDGQRIWPAFGTRALVAVAPVRQYQFVQQDRRSVEARIALWRPFEGEEQQRLLAHLRDKMPDGMTVQLKLVDEIPRSPGGKYEDFVCNLRD
jgi:phenylacetate-CoA ligase